MTQFKAKLTLFLICFCLGAVAFVFAIGDSMALIDDFHDHRAIIASEPYAASGLILSVMAFAIAAICLLPQGATPVAGRRSKAATARSKWAGRFLIFVLGCIVAAGLAPVVQYHVVDDVAVRRGYVRCPEVVWPRRQPDRWALSAEVGTCPAGSAAAH